MATTTATLIKNGNCIHNHCEYKHTNSRSNQWIDILDSTKAKVLGAGWDIGFVSIQGDCCSDVLRKVFEWVFEL